MDFSGVLSNHEYLSVTAYLATCSTLAGLGAIFVILRLGASFKQAGKPYLDGYASIIGLLLLIANFILTHRLQVRE
ncbi:unnamed protein product [Clonostachys rosea f. rosea IK726]|uniref:Uncharacterized protein n=1 Tax=Clonostachys rosea f. rosea IK726 TaxID=1349383 RepID=A0ACA9UKM8_BIOOC|nr:unnamed protein product [Clonostachys rosea f. rosea IK726]